MHKTPPRVSRSNGKTNEKYETETGENNIAKEQNSIKLSRFSPADSLVIPVFQPILYISEIILLFLRSFAANHLKISQVTVD